MGRPALDISALTPDERLELIGELWDSLTPDDVPLTPAQRDELKRRLDRLDAEGPSGSPWSDVEARIRSRARCPRYTGEMHNEFTAIFERDGEWFIAYCPEVPGANGQGRSKDEARSSLAEAIALVLQDRREDALRGLPEDAVHETVTVD